MTKALLQQAHDALLSSTHAIRNLLQGADKAIWPKWLAVSDEADAVRDQIAEALAQPEPEPVAWLVEGWHDGKLIAHISHLSLDDAKTSASVFSQHYTTTKTVPLYATPPAAPAPAGMVMVPTQLTFDAFRKANVTRCVKWHPAGIGSWSPSDWLVAALGELGELASEVKMFNRDRDGLAGNKVAYTPDERRKRMESEAADVVTYLDLFCAERGIDLGQAIVRKFNEVSERVGFPDRIELAAAPAPAVPEMETRADGKLVRVDRWEWGIRRIVALLWGNRKEFEIDEVVQAVKELVPYPHEDDESLCTAVERLSAAPAVREPLTKESLQRHAMFAADAPPASAVVLLSSLHRLLGIGGGGK